MTTTFGWSTHDATAMSWRSLRAQMRHIDSLLLSILLPIFLMLLFVYVFGSAMEVGANYADYVLPGVIVLCAGYGAGNTAVAVASDVQHGVINRFKSMPIVSSSVLVGHVVASAATNVVATSIVIGVAFITGFRPTAGVLEWVAAAGLILFFIVALSWLGTAIGLLVRNIEAASGATFFVLFLPYLSSAFVPTEGLPSVIRPIAEYQPFTPLIEAIRSFLLGTPMENSLWLALLWLGGITIVGYAASVRLFSRPAA